MERGLVIAVGEEDRVIDGQDFDVGIFCPDLVELLGDSLIDGDLTGALGAENRKGDQLIAIIAGKGAELLVAVAHGSKL